MIEIRNVNKYFGDTQVLKDINITIKDGEIFGIIGHSGAGKSTLLRCINRLEDFSSGQVLIDGTDVGKLNENDLRDLRKNLGMIFQHFSLLERRTVFENVALPMECFGYSKDQIKTRVEELLDLVGILDKKDDKPRNLSGGQKQRVAIARALTMNPKVLLCDEATSALDPKTTKSILELLRQISGKLGITIIMVTHQMEVIKQICTRTAIMDAGRVVEMGDTEEVFLKSNKAIRKLLGEENIVLPQGNNLKLLFTNDKSNEAIITSMARELNIDVSIIYGRLEKFRDDILGSLIINIPDGYVDSVKDYLNRHDMIWQEVEDEL
ncbi:MULTISPECIES: methionine ABC transporter ATP-binding protein [Peptostreptococcus]|uniref:methionine ABC transporter ATP-binding protein n=1 Tax=Peptostreptococcus TaxID=1257 RepID=UPI00076786FA|nr:MULTISPECIES: ATP-binding cassette domain-containing protein [Peptostreptococcus]MBS5597085.1 ATP-binding cassette domain-containing protein [Peptostreptococcus sp.]MDB8850313.1 ATP-binding cassette domain-containing protein [Peptostreptococcus anaerobius]MDB8854020.1 ATP-binding cassette domain-containing protein [Peptostreptococcus anaerobius]MDB8855851.1 ATP-binding cassette domain-containing protein [Peptostreptococcus anaerobius]MDU0964067.1 ATP-binding cassette domain-containing prote